MVTEVRHIDFDTLIMINQQVVSLTGEKHEYTEEDAKRIKSMLKEVEGVSGSNQLDSAIRQEAALLIFRIASGQNFHEGNKRTALVAGLAFLEMNGYTLDIKDPLLVSVVDKTGVGAASLNDIKVALGKLIRNV